MIWVVLLPCRIFFCQESHRALFFVQENNSTDLRGSRGPGWEEATAGSTAAELTLLATDLTGSSRELHTKQDWGIMCRYSSETQLQVAFVHSTFPHCPWLIFLILFSGLQVIMNSTCLNSQRLKIMQCSRILLDSLTHYWWPEMCLCELYYYLAFLLGILLAGFICMYWRQMASLSLHFHTILISVSMLLFAYIFTCSKDFHCFFSVPELSSENLRTCFQIVNAYLYLSATDFLQVRHSNYWNCV